MWQFCWYKKEEITRTTWQSFLPISYLSPVQPLLCLLVPPPMSRHIKDLLSITAISGPRYQISVLLLDSISGPRNGSIRTISVEGIIVKQLSTVIRPFMIYITKICTYYDKNKLFIWDENMEIISLYLVKSSSILKYFLNSGSRRSSLYPWSKSLPRLISTENIKVTHIAGTLVLGPFRILWNEKH